MKESDDWCYGGSVSVTCDNIGLSVIPDDLPNSVVCLRIRGNTIPVLNFVNPYSHLKHLDLANNTIVAIKHFSGLNGLEILNLSTNALNLTRMETSVFKDLTALSELIIHNNIWQNSTKYRDDIIGARKNLTVLHLDGLPNGIEFGSDFGNLGLLQELQIYGGLNIIDNKTLEVFKGINISRLYIRSGVLKHVDEMAFDPLGSLLTLSLSDNCYLGLHSAKKVFKGLSPSLEHLYLQHLIGNGYKPVTIKKDFFFRLNKTHLKTLWLDNNNILNIETGISQNLPSLEALSLNCNKLQTSLILFQDICHLANLTFLSLAYQTRTHFGMNCNDDTLYRKYKRDEDRRGYDYQDKDDDVDNTDDYYCPCRRNPTIPEWVLPIKLQVINYRGSLIIDETLSKNHMRLKCYNNLSYIDFSWNYINRLEGQVLIDYPNIRNELVLLHESNMLTYIDPFLLNTSISKGLKVGSLSFYDNRLGVQIEEDKEGLLFSQYKDLKHLNLGSNLIKEILPNAFKNLLHLQTLNLTLNFLRSVDFEFSHMVNLTYLDLSLNLLASLTTETMVKMDVLGENLYVDLSRNPLVCSCSNLNFLRWIRKTRIKLVSYMNYECLMEFSGTFIQLSEFYYSYFNNMEKACYSQSYLTISGIMTGVTLLIGGITVCVYRHRWDLKFFMLHIRQKYSKQAQILDRTDYKYDAFVAYHEADLNWVKNELVKTLDLQGYECEEQDSNRLKLCLHHRNFIPGATIEENIVQSIESSRKTILVLSCNFVKSTWCDFEVQMARQYCVDKGKDLIVIVKLEDVQASAMSRTLRKLFRRVTYLEWPLNPLQRSRFWKRLREAVRDPALQPVQCECGRVIS